MRCGWIRDDSRASGLIVQRDDEESEQLLGTKAGGPLAEMESMDVLTEVF